MEARGIHMLLGLGAVASTLVGLLVPERPAVGVFSKPAMLPAEHRVARAALRMITEGESRCGNLSPYKVIYSCTPFEDESRHPDVCIPITDIPGYEGQCSTAAGRYQFITTTWQRAVSYCARQGIEITSFSPQDQDMGALCLMAQIGALQEITGSITINPADGSATVDRESFEQFLVKASSEWASLAYSDAGQPKLSSDVLWDLFNQHLRHENAISPHQGPD